jgi:hypothetical protein
MRLFLSQKISPPTDPLDELSSQLNVDLQQDCSRYEPEVFAERRVPVDPYLEWAAQRAAEREREDPTSDSP